MATPLCTTRRWAANYTHFVRAGAKWIARPYEGIGISLSKPTSMRARTVVAAFVAGGVLAPITPSASAAPDRQLALIAYRTTTGAAALDLQVSAPPGSKPSIIAMVVATVERSRIASLDLAGVLLSGEADRVQVKANGSRTTLCDEGVCMADTSTQTAGSAITIRNEAGDDRYNVMFVVARGASVTYSAKAKGWAIKRVTLPYRIGAGADTAVTAAYALGSGAEVFGDVSAPGGASGSIAVSEPPCSESVNGTVSRGAGTLTLDGGVTRPKFTCPTDRGALASWALRRTTWRVHGTMAGETTQAGARLFVLDLPKKLPTPRNWPWR